MRQIIVTEFVTLDGVMEAPGGEPTHPHTGWTEAYHSPEMEDFKFGELRDVDIHLLGRVTYESFAGAWPTYEGPFADHMNSMPKVVVSSTLVDPAWNNTSVVPDLDAVRAIQADGDGPLLVAGSCRLVHSLLVAGMVDEIRLNVFPISIGAGLRVFPDDQVRQVWERVDTLELPRGVRIDTYRPER